MTLPALLLLAALAPGATVTRDIEYVKRGTTPLLLDASVPDGPGPFPTVIIVHGGGFVRGNKVTYVPPLFPPLTEARFTWFTIDYRLAPASKLPDPVDDIVAALAWVHAHAKEYKVDPKRVALMGESAGAYLVDYAAMIAPKSLPLAAVVSFYGPHDFTVSAKKRGAPSEGMTGLTGVTELNEEGLKRLAELSPYSMVKKGLPPFLLIHGTADEQVPYEQSPRFCEALKAKGVPCELYTVPGAGHGMGGWEKVPEFQGYKVKMVEWLRQTMK
ncbi:MAG TPA: alpha/beta hydrolase [Paludibaculum sp.]|jgi:alpha-L-fucosidase 2